MLSLNKQSGSLGVKSPDKSFKSNCMTKQECRKLQAVVKELSAESSKLKDELLNLSEECGKLRDENDSIMEELAQMHGSDAISDLVAKEPDVDGKSNSDEQTSSSEKEQHEELARMCRPVAIFDVVAMEPNIDGGCNSDEQTMKKNKKKSWPNCAGQMQSLPGGYET